MDQVFANQIGQVRGQARRHLPGRQDPYRGVMKYLTLHRSLLEHRALAGDQRLEPRRQQGLDRLWDDDRTNFTCELDQLLEEQSVAVACRYHLLTHCGLERVVELIQQLLALTSRQ